MNCLEIDNDEHTRVLRMSPDTVCWSDYHRFYVLAIALPGLLFWGLATPLLAFYLLYSNRVDIKKIIKSGVITTIETRKSAYTALIHLL